MEVLVGNGIWSLGAVEYLATPREGSPQTANFPIKKKEVHAAAYSSWVISFIKMSFPLEWQVPCAFEIGPHLPKHINA